MTQPSTARLLAYLRDCLADERSRAGISNVFASRVRSRRFITGEEKASEHEFASLDLPPSAAESLGKTASLHQRDSDLFYATLFLAGRQEGKEYVAPTLLYPVDCSWDGPVPQFSLLHRRLHLNPALFALFELPPSFENTLHELLPGGELDITGPTRLARELEGAIPQLDWSGLHAFPQLVSPSRLKEAAAQGPPVLLPASALVLADKSKNVAGLLHELEQLRALPDESLPPSFHAILGGKTETLDLPSETPDLAPALLSPAQQRLLQSSAHAPLTVCHGPPGTGKSFTIAAAALDHVARRQSVLIACRSNEAADVIHDKINELLPRSSLVLRAGRHKHLRKLKSFLDRILSNALPSPVESPWASRNPKEGTPESAARQLAKLEHKLGSRLREALDEGRWFHEDNEAFWAPFRRWLHSFDIKRHALLCDYTRALHRLHAHRLRVIDAFHKNLHEQRLVEGLKNTCFRDTLRKYRKALGRRKSADQEAGLLGLDHANLLNLFPVWITTTDDIHRILPLTPALFELVVIDEATQCDLASPLPILARGKRALLTGDPQQLRHISFLSRERIASLGRKHGLDSDQLDTFDFRRVSLIDRALDQAGATSATIFLNEHFRSLPELIRFCDKHFYHDALHFMRDPENLQARPSGLVSHRVDGRCDNTGVNHEEITHILQAYRKLLASTPAQPLATPPTLGFLSPFRAQVEGFLTRLQAELDPAHLQLLLQQHQLIAGTAHSFQGAERDIIHLSFALDPDSHSSARRFLERPDVFNVSITRAREELHIVHSLDHRRLPADSLLRRYLLAATEQSTVTVQGRPADSHENLPDLIPALAAHGWEVVPCHSLAGVPIDLLVRKGDKVVAIDLVGTQGIEGLPVSIPKSLLLKRAGTPLLPLGIGEWQTRRDDFLAVLNSFGKQNRGF